MNGFYFDLETTGVDPFSDRIVEVGATTVTDGRTGVPHNGEFIGGGAWVTFVNPGVEIPAGASRVHGITDERVADAPSFADIAPRMVERIERADYVCAFNGLWFDVPMLVAELDRVGLTMPQRPVLDPIDWQAKQPAIADAIDAERDAFSYWFYVNRDTGAALHMACGKCQGTPVAEMDTGYFEFIVSKDDERGREMPENCRRIMDNIIAGDLDESAEVEALTAARDRLYPQGSRS